MCNVSPTSLCDTWQEADGEPRAGVTQENLGVACGGRSLHQQPLSGREETVMFSMLRAHGTWCKI